MNIVRNNISENQVLQATMNVLPNANVFEKDNNIGIVEVRKEIFKGINIFLDAQNPNKTEKGNYKRTEFRISVNKKDIWVEVKQQKTTTNIVDSVLGEIARARFFDGDYWLVLLGEPYRVPSVIFEYANAIKLYGLQKKIKLFTSITDYQSELKKAV